MYDLTRLLRDKCEHCGKMRCYECLNEYEQEEASREVKRMLLGGRKKMIKFTKTAPPRGKKCIFIGRGKNVLLHRSIYRSYRLADSLEDIRKRTESENQKVGRGNEGKGNERKQNIFHYPRNETLISKNIRRCLWQ